MESVKKINIGIVGHCGTGKELLSKALIEKIETVESINENKLDEFERAGFHLTEYQKECLRKLGISDTEIVNILTEYDFLEKLSEKWNELVKDEITPSKKKNKVWDKKKFYE